MKANHGRGCSVQHSETTLIYVGKAFNGQQFNVESESKLKRHTILLIPTSNTGTIIFPICHQTSQCLVTHPPFPCEH